MIDKASGPPTPDQIHVELLRLVGEALGEELPPISGDIPILDLMVSSLALVDGMRRIYDHFGVLMSIRRVLEGQATLNGIAEYIAQQLSAPAPQPSGAAARAGQEPDDEVTRVPFAPSQRHVGFLTRYSPEASAAFSDALAVRVEGALNGPALQAALDAVADRYEALRTSLSAAEDELEVHPRLPIEWRLSSYQARELDATLADIVRRPFVPGDRLFRAELLRESDHRHVLVLVGHQLVVDTEALQIVFEELAACYSAYAADREPDGGFPALQWTDYFAMGQAEAAVDARDAARAFWLPTLSQSWPRLELPSDYPRPPVKRYGGARLVRPLDRDLTDRVGSWAASQGLTLRHVVFGAYRMYLSRLAGQHDVVVGVRSAPLYLDAGERVVAQTRNMLPVRLQVDGPQTFARHALAVAAAIDDAERNRHLSMSDMVPLVNLPRDQSRSALFTAAFQEQRWQNPPACGSLQASWIDLPSPGARYDIELTMVATPGAERLICDYSTELFRPETITRWMDGLMTLLQAGVANADANCRLLPVMPAEQLQQLLYGWNATDRAVPLDKTAFDVFANQASASPEAPAVRCRDEQWTYRQLFGRMDAIAARLSEEGVVSGDRVAILMERSPDLLAALLATWRVGAIYFPLDQGFPQARVSYMLTDAGARVCVTSRELAPRLGPTFGGRVVCVDDLAHAPTRPGVGVAAAAPDSGAYLIYTSGSTGQPKGVVVGHRGLLNCVLSTQALIGFASGDALLALTTVSFDISLVELLMPLVSGGVVDIVPDGMVGDGVALAGMMASHRPKYVQATPSTWKSVLAGGWQGDNTVCVGAAGEALSRELAEQLLQRSAGLWNLYGPSETAIYSVVAKIVSAPGQPVPIGRPPDNTQLYVLDDQRQPVPLGALGELYIGGDGVAPGYWSRPDLTAERFVDNPYRPGTRMYRTGDLVRYLPAGDLLCLGRIDDQVKIHGVRVELGEVEAALRDVEGVRDAVATIWRDAHGDLQLVGHVIAASPAPSATAIRSRLRERLPAAMVPPHILFADAFPLTASGKIHRSDLPLPGGVAGGPISPTEAPVTPTEKLLAEAWSRVLPVDVAAIGRDSNFMDLGGHSLLMTPLMVEVRRLFDVSFSLRVFFDAPTIRSFASAIADRRRTIATHDSGNRLAAPARTAGWGRQRMAMLLREADLPPGIAPARGMSYSRSARIDTILLTGATGFLGVYIIADILRTTSAQVYCLVRPKRGQDGKARIEKQMRHYDVWPGDEAWMAQWRSRLHVVEGDVTLPRLGMAAATYETLARDVDAILHGAAHVNFIYPYEALRATNVLGLHEIVRFAFEARIKPVHHLSTAAIWPMGAQFTFYEKDPIEHGQALNLGYDEAKWVGERCLLNAAERGLPTTRYRPGEVGGDSITGRCVTDHFLVACVRGFLEFGAFPVLDIEVDVAPVDYVAKALTYLVFHREPTGGAYHLTNPNRQHMRQALTYLRGLGYQFEELRFEQLRDRLVGSPAFGSNPLFAYQAALEDMDDVSLQLPTYDTREADRALKGSGITCPPADDKLFGVYLTYLQHIGMIPEPALVASAAQGSSRTVASRQ
ncbi:MAG: amino acid adenylation domain-containing protein [Acidobacteriota bacterium]